jgi:hypothetical protein
MLIFVLNWRIKKVWVIFLSDVCSRKNRMGGKRGPIFSIFSNCRFQLLGPLSIFSKFHFQTRGHSIRLIGNRALCSLVLKSNAFFPYSDGYALRAFPTSFRRGHPRLEIRSKSCQKTSENNLAYRYNACLPCRKTSDINSTYKS